MATYYVNPTGSDSGGAGTSGNPWATHTKAYISSTAGDTIFCQPGTYTFSGASGASIGFLTSRTLIGASYLTGNALPVVIFDCSGNNHQWSFGGTWNLSGVTFQNFANNASNQGNFNINDNCILSFTNCVFRNWTFSPSYAAMFGAGAHNDLGTNTILNINKCLFYNNNNNGASIGGYFGGGDNPLLTANVINNTFYSTGAGTSIFGRLNGAYTYRYIFKNNIICTAVAVGFSGYSANPFVPLTGSITNWVSGYTAVPVTPINVLGSGDPLFVDPTNNNYNLRPTSPVIDVGTP